FNGEGWIMEGNGSARVAGIDHMHLKSINNIGNSVILGRPGVETSGRRMVARTRDLGCGGRRMVAIHFLFQLVLRRLGSLFTSVYAAVQKLKKAFAKSFSSAWLTISSWTMSISLTEVEMKCFTSRRKPEGQWTGDERKAANLDQRLKVSSYKLKYEETLIDSIYETEKSKSLVYATPMSTAFISTSIFQDFQDSPDDEKDTRSSHEYLNDLEEEYQARALLSKSKRFFKKGTQRFSSAKSTDQNECHKCGKKAKLALLSSSTSTSKAATVKNKALIAETYERDEEEVSLDDNDMVEVKLLMAIAEENDAISKEGAKNGEWVKISMRMVHNLLEMEDNDDRKT
ncbi:hypothetical protein Tco_1280742, partial [Tanacetum coccineum]